MKELERMIPKTIHYCWFGETPLPGSAIKCIDSWRRFFPDCQIIEWNESNFDITQCDYCKEAYAKSDWAFVSDYARFKILYDYGGIYFDTDVEVISDMSDMLSGDGFFAKESLKIVAPGLGMAAIKHHKIYAEVLNEYHNRHYINSNGTCDKTTVVNFLSKLFIEKYKWVPQNTIQEIDGITIYPEEYCCPMNNYTGEILITENTRSIHYFDSSWFTPRQAMVQSIKRKCSKVMPEQVSGPIASLISKMVYRD